MEVTILASGSGGNCIAVRSGDTTLLIDAGIPAAKIERRLLETGIRPDDVRGIFLTHAHRDHIQGLALANKYRIPVYAPVGEWRDVKGLDAELRRLFPKEGAAVNGNGHSPYMVVTPFRVHHDAYEPVGYVVDTFDSRLSICLDTGRVDGEMLAAMAGSDIYIIEANHDPDMLAASDYPDVVKERIMSDRGHLSNQQAADALARLVQGKGERIYLTHLSKKSNLPALARMTVEETLRRCGFVRGKHYHLEVV